LESGEPRSRMASSQRDLTRLPIRIYAALISSRGCETLHPSFQKNTAWCGVLHRTEVAKNRSASRKAGAGC
jgi:hypothetical protein